MNNSYLKLHSSYIGADFHGQKYHHDRKQMPFFSISQKLEAIAARFKPVSLIYYKLFYQKMLEKELDMANLKPRSNVLHIGSGRYPYTAIYLAKTGHTVEAWDLDPMAVIESRQIINKLGMESVIKVHCKDAISIKHSNHDAIWVSLNVKPKEVVLQNSLKALSSGGGLIYRVLPRWISNSSRSIFSENNELEYDIKECLSLAGTKSILVKSRHLNITRDWQPGISGCFDNICPGMIKNKVSIR